MLKGFKDFIMRGNVVDLAVGVVIGAAFTSVVTQLTNSFLKPLITVVVLLITGRADGLDGATPAGEKATSGADHAVPKIFDVPFDWIAFVNSAITFVLTAAVLYFLVVFPMNKLAERRKRGEEPPPAAPSEEVKLLTEIRDALVAAGRVPAQRQGGPDSPVDWNTPRSDR
ncbi:large conductance mechanosensitive channel protein MscL [Micromonospora sonneratiae]|uniref:Large-conductance mechanosensitive channel n=1 Tax=Micromonospora sonneratiae TaxID=1184706 RepID=A0ABW3YPN9_9ACTN